VDNVFKALADPTRRSLLDELHKNDGQTLSALEERLPMTRFGVMKHLRVLEDAGSRRYQTQRPREAALSQSGPDPFALRTLGEQICGTMDRHDD
jgi:predicted transcriptional regulator